jgi:hypothetical protein
MDQLIKIAALLFFLLPACQGPDTKISVTKVPDTIPVTDTSLIPMDSTEYYFPLEGFRDSMEYDGQDVFLDTWYSKHLFAMREPIIFKDKSQNEIYRFTWLRTFNDPIAIRIEKHGDNYALYWKSCDGAGGYAPGKLITDQRKVISKETWNEFIKRIDQIDFWNLPTNEKVLGMDGAQWILEGKTPTKYHVTDRWTPDEKSNYYQCCSFLIEQTDLKINPRDKY